MKRLLLGLILPIAVLVLSRPAFSAPRGTVSNTLEAKLALESSLEKRLRSLLTEILGSEDVVVLINADLRAEQEEKDASEEVMPGVPIKDTPTAPATLGSTLTMVRRIRATIIVDKATSDSDVELIRRVTAGLLGLSVDKQDNVTIEKMVFRKARPLAAADFLTPEQLWKLPWFLLALIFAGLWFVGFLRPFLAIGRDIAGTLRSQSQNAREAAARPEPGAAATAKANGAAASNGAAGDHADTRPFSFIREEHVPKLLHLMRRGTPEHLAMVVHYLPPSIASRFLAAQTDDVREKVAQYLADVTELEEQAVRDVEKWIRSRIEFMVGGEEKLSEILESLPGERQDELLSKIAEKNPSLRGRLERQLTRLEDIAALEPAELQALLRRVPFSTWAQVLKARRDLWDSVRSKLPASMVERLTQEMALARDIPPERLHGETLRVVSAMKDMIRDGWITLVKGPPEAAPDAPAGGGKG